MQPIGPVGQDPIASVTEAMLRYGNNQDLKGAQAREVAASLPEDVPFEGDVVQLAEAPPQGKPSAPQAQGTPPGKDGQDEARQQALSQHAAEQHGRQELRWTGERHVQRSTREIIHHVEGGHVEEHHGPTGAHARGPSHATGHASGHASGHAAGPARQRSVSAGAPHLGGEVVAAAVGSGLFSPADVAEDEEQGFEFDENAEQMDSSHEATAARLSQQGKKLADRGGMQSSLGFDRQQDEERRQFTPGQQSFQQGRQDDERRREAPETVAERRGDEVRVGEEPASAGLAEDSRGEVVPETSPVAAASSAAEPQAAATAAEPVPDTVDRHAVISPGVDLLTDDEYFFFDDARFAPDAA